MPWLAASPRTVFINIYQYLVCSSRFVLDTVPLKEIQMMGGEENDEEKRTSNKTYT